MRETLALVALRDIRERLFPAAIVEPRAELRRRIVMLPRVASIAAPTKPHMYAHWAPVISLYFDYLCYRATTLNPGILGSNEPMAGEQRHDTAPRRAFRSDTLLSPKGT